MDLKKLKRIGLIILVLALLLFIFTNTESAPITVIYRDFDVPLILVMLLPLGIGFALGIYVARNIGRDRPAKNKQGVDPASAGAADKSSPKAPTNP